LEHNGKVPPFTVLLKLVTLAWAAMVFVLSVIKVPTVNSIPTPHLDKIVHFLMYGVLTLLALYAFGVYTQKQAKRRLLIVFGLVLFGFFIEIVQKKFFSYRSFEISDILANLTGIFVSLLMYALIHLKEHQKHIV